MGDMSESRLGLGNLPSMLKGPCSQVYGGSFPVALGGAEVRGSVRGWLPCMEVRQGTGVSPAGVEKRKSTEFT